MTKHRDRKLAPSRGPGRDRPPTYPLTCGHETSDGPTLSNPDRWWCPNGCGFKGRGPRKKEAAA